ncbi:MAG: hypothetical protein JST26_18395 [Bacteroidetes bacterium]|nr:hypothetical protein [Bacteroidota bacterium]
MKHLPKTLILVSLLAVFTACKSHKDAGASSATSSTQSSSDNTAKETYRLIVSFMSKGNGANSDQRQKFLDYVAQHPKKPEYKSVMWGREGETDYCFKLTELSKKEQTEFVDAVKKITEGTTLVGIKENVECEHKGRLQTKQ